jgi:hypothetical protein
MGSDVTGQQRLPRSPYPSDINELVDAFCVSRERADLLRGLLSFRDMLRQVGFTSGFQWIDGSFVEHCEAVRGRPPSDVDILSFLRRPVGLGDNDAWSGFVGLHQATLFYSEWTKRQFHCDSYFIDLDGTAEAIASFTTYWAGLFSHQRDTFRWKGLVQIPFSHEADNEALALIEERVQQW